jgi:hypothetical protein
VSRETQDISTVEFAGQVGRKDTETLFSLRGPVSRLEVVDREWSFFPRHVRSTTRFKEDGNRIDHTVETIKDGQWRLLSRYVYGYTDIGARSGPCFYRVGQDGEQILDHSVQFEYEENKVRRKLQRQFDAAGDLTFTQYFSYDDLGRRRKIEWVLPSGDILRTYLFSYLRCAGFFIRIQKGLGPGGRFSFLDVLGESRRWSVLFRQNRWSLPAFTLTVLYAFDRHGNFERARGLRLFCFKRILPMIGLIRRVRELQY